MSLFDLSVGSIDFPTYFWARQARIRPIEDSLCSRDAVTSFEWNEKQRETGALLVLCTFVKVRMAFERFFLSLSTFFSLFGPHEGHFGTEMGSFWVILYRFFLGHFVVLLGSLWDPFIFSGFCFVFVVFTLF